MKIKNIDKLNSIQKERILEIWNNVYPDFFNLKDITDFNDYLSKLTNSEHYIIEQNGKVFAWAAKFDRDAHKWFVVLIDSEKQGNGLGSQLMDKLKVKEIELNGWVIKSNKYQKRDGSQYFSPIEFYKKNGFIITNEQLKNEKFTALKVKWNFTAESVTGADINKL